MKRSDCFVALVNAAIALCHTVAIMPLHNEQRNSSFVSNADIFTSHNPYISHIC